MTPPGTIVLLNGTGSAGKTSIARAIQARADEPWLHLGMDQFYLDICPPHFLLRELAPGATPTGDEREAVLFVPTGGEPLETAIVIPPFGHQLISGLHHTVAALAGLGHRVVVDHVLSEPAWLRECVALWAPFPVLFVGVRCPLAVVEAREAARAERTVKGLVRWLFDRVHMYGDYDLEVGTAAATPEDCADAILRRLAGGPPPAAFRRLAEDLPDIAP
ncbi:MAG: chloramphenicol phosphotransferase CPT family protein [Thermomicrobiales bacterium]